METTLPVDSVTFRMNPHTCTLMGDVASTWASVRGSFELLASGRWQLVGMFCYDVETGKPVTIDWMLEEFRRVLCQAVAREPIGNSATMGWRSTVLPIAR